MFPGVGGRTGLGLITHSFHEQFPVEDYGEEHPEYYALVDGKRKLDGFYDGPQLCLSNPEVLERVTTAVMEELAENRLPGMCPSARRTTTTIAAANRTPRSTNAKDPPMGSILTFVNAVADEVAKVRPDVSVGAPFPMPTRGGRRST